MAKQKTPTMLTAALVACCLATMATVSSADSTDALYHSSVNFTCTGPPGSDIDLSTLSSTQLQRLWILPNDDLIRPGTSTDHERVQVLEDGALLHVSEVEDEDFGWYYCLIHLTTTDQYLMQKYGLNVHGPYWGDLYELKYKGMVTTGLMAGGICFVLTGVLCFLYGRQQTRLEKKADEERAVGRINEGYQSEDSPKDTRGSKKGQAPAPPAEQQESPTVACSADNDTTQL